MVANEGLPRVGPQPIHILLEFAVDPMGRPQMPTIRTTNCDVLALPALLLMAMTVANKQLTDLAIKALKEVQSQGIITPEQYAQMFGKLPSGIG